MNLKDTLAKLVVLRSRLSQLNDQTRMIEGQYEKLCEQAHTNFAERIFLDGEVHFATTTFIMGNKIFIVSERGVMIQTAEVVPIGSALLIEHDNHG